MNPSDKLLRDDGRSSVVILLVCSYLSERSDDGSRVDDQSGKVGPEEGSELIILRRKVRLLLVERGLVVVLLRVVRHRRDGKLERRGEEGRGG